MMAKTTEEIDALSRKIETIRCTILSSKSAFSAKDHVALCLFATLRQVNLGFKGFAACSLSTLLELPL